MEELPYFARKSNAFNQYFVKMLWSWVTGAFIIHLITLSLRRARPQNRFQAILRYLLITSVWIITTQWFFGPPLIDRSFRLTGGQCERVEAGALEDEPTKEFLTATACKVAGGDWTGGHDISGHTFILVLGSVFLVLEALPAFWMVFRRQQPVESSKEKTDARQTKKQQEEDQSLWLLSLAIVSGVVGTALWMLLQTIIHFHTWREKLSGLVVALAGLALVYILPSYVPVLESLVGKPSI